MEQLTKQSCWISDRFKEDIKIMVTVIISTILITTVITTTTTTTTIIIIIIIIVVITKDYIGLSVIYGPYFISFRSYDRWGCASK